MKNDVQHILIKRRFTREWYEVLFYIYLWIFPIGIIFIGTLALFPDTTLNDKLAGIIILGLGLGLAYNVLKQWKSNFHFEEITTNYDQPKNYELSFKCSKKLGFAIYQFENHNFFLQSTSKSHLGSYVTFVCIDNAILLNIRPKMGFTIWFQHLHDMRKTKRELKRKAANKTNKQ